MPQLILELLGWSADILFLLAYFLVSTRRLDGDGRAFNLMNLGGAILYGTYAVIRKTFPVLALELFWGAIAIRALWKLYVANRTFKMPGW